MRFVRWFSDAIARVLLRVTGVDELLDDAQLTREKHARESGAKSRYLREAAHRIRQVVLRMPIEIEELRDIAEFCEIRAEHRDEMGGTHL